MLLEDVIRLHLPAIYPGDDILSSHVVRITRDADLPRPGRPENLLASIEESLPERRRAGGAAAARRAISRPTSWPGCWTSWSCSPMTPTRARGWRPSRASSSSTRRSTCPGSRSGRGPRAPCPRSTERPDIWSALRAQDFLVHHPYHAFDAVTRFVREASVDPQVLAIKMTLYRVSSVLPDPARPPRGGRERQGGHRPGGAAGAIRRGGEHPLGPRARGGRRPRGLRSPGLQDPRQGLPGRPTGGRRRPALLPPRDRQLQRPHRRHLQRSRALHRRESFGEDLTQLFDLLTGGARPTGFHHLLVAPLGLRDGLVERIRREVAHARAGRPARIIAKMNGLVDRRLIEELYAASAAGVTIDLIVRGVCCLRPAVKGRSENIRVVSIVDRYLEHARVFHFQNAGAPEYLLASADWMPRNLDRRVEIAFPVLAPRPAGPDPGDPRDPARRYREGAPHARRRHLGAHPAGARSRAPLPGLALRGGRPRGRPERVAGHCSGPLSPPSSCHGSAGTGTGRPWR